MHALVDEQGRLRRVLITAGQLHDGQSAHPLIADLPPGAVLLGDKEARNVERAFCRLKDWRRFATRYDKLA